jgi:hypothetical protein
MTSHPLPPLTIGRGVIPAALIREAHSRFGAIPGCAMTHMEDRNGSTRLCFDGWSPSLHAMKCDVTMPEDPVRAGGAVLDMMEIILQVQRRRADAGLALGTALPLSAVLAMNRGVTAWTVEMPEVRHLWVDRSALDFVHSLAGRREMDRKEVVRKMIAEPLSRMHEGGMGPYSRISGNTLSLDDGDGVPMADMPFTAAPGMRVEGARLTLLGRLVPDTTASALAGRPLADLVTPPDHYEDRILDRVEAEDGATIVHLVPDRVRLDSFVPDWPERIEQEGMF